MSRFSGAQGKGAAKQMRVIKREEAEARNALTLPENRSRKSRARALLIDVFATPEGSEAPS